MVWVLEEGRLEGDGRTEEVEVGRTGGVATTEGVGRGAGRTVNAYARSSSEISGGHDFVLLYNLDE